MRKLLKLLNIQVLKMYSDKSYCGEYFNCYKICYCVGDLTAAQIAQLTQAGCVVTEATYNDYGVKLNNYDYYIRWKRTV